MLGGWGWGMEGREGRMSTAFCILRGTASRSTTGKGGTDTGCMLGIVVFLMWSLHCFVCFLYLFCFCLAAPRGLWDLSSQTRDWNWALRLAVKTWSPNHWITRKFPPSLVLYAWGLTMPRDRRGSLLKGMKAWSTLAPVLCRAPVCRWWRGGGRPVP